MVRSAFVIMTGMPPTGPVDLPAVKAALQHFVDNLTEGQVVEGIVTWPEGPGDAFLLPVLVENGA